jgi:hypothetical protein
MVRSLCGPSCLRHRQDLGRRAPKHAEGIGVWMEETRKDGVEIPAPSVVTVADAG